MQASAPFLEARDADPTTYTCRLQVAWEGLVWSLIIVGDAGPRCELRVLTF
jgi:hypothetical protein